MPNIILTEYCNLQCPYCFASQMISDAQLMHADKNISLDQFLNILNWLTPSALQGEFQIGLIGGEPTLHPQFKEILKQTNIFCSSTQSNAILFTNGILLEQFLPYIGENMFILININNLQTSQKEKLFSSLNLINNLNWFLLKKVTLGCNLYLKEIDYNYFWDCVDQYKDISLVRVSVTAPNSNELKTNKEKYYSQMKPIFLKFVENALSRNIQLTYDCNQIPKCFFSDEEWNKIIEAGQPRDLCEPVIDITPDFKATCCFGVYNTPINCNKFNDIFELTKYFQSLMIQKCIHNNNSMCKDCEKIKLMQCQGGCLAFSTLDKIN